MKQYESAIVVRDAQVQAKQQRRKVQNRKNQRAHRLRLKKTDAETDHESRPFQVRRWRLDESEDCYPQNTSAALEAETITHMHIDTSLSIAGSAVVLRGLPPTTHKHPPFTFPLPSDHLLHLIQYNVFRALLSNKHTLNTVPDDPTMCPITEPCLDDTTIYPSNPDIPPCLIPTTLQRTRYHPSWVNVIPFPRIRDNLIMREGHFDHWELMRDLIGELMSIMPVPKRRNTPVTSTEQEFRRFLPLISGSDPDEVTGGRTGLIVWGEPHEMQSWEATPGFLAKWAWVVEGCEELVEMSNRWRMKRGEEPMRISVSKSYPPPLLLHVTSSGK